MSSSEIHSAKDRVEKVDSLSLLWDSFKCLKSKGACDSLPRHEVMIKNTALTRISVNSSN